MNQIQDDILKTSEGKKSFKNAIISCWLGTAMEYADFALYGLAAATVFSEIFYPEQTPIIALMLSFATFGVGFVARPIGALFFGKMGDKYGRKKVMMITIFLMGIATTLIGFIPSYASIGIFAPLLLVVLRFLQGFGAGAELSGGAIMLGEYAPSKNRGLVSSIIALGSNSGTLIASGIWFLLSFMNKEDFLEWGWRLPFVFSFLIALFALYLRRFVGETPVFAKQLELMQNTREENLKSYTEENKAFGKKQKHFG